MPTTPKGICFIIGPIGRGKSSTRVHADKVRESIVKPVAEPLGYTVERADTLPKPGIITNQIIKLLYDSPLVVADLTGRNANVFYELGVRDALGKHTVLIMKAGQKVPFDKIVDRIIFFDLTNQTSIDQCIDKMQHQIEEMERNPRRPDNPVSSALGPLRMITDRGIVPEEVRDRLKLMPELAHKHLEIDQKYPELCKELQGMGLNTYSDLVSLTTSPEIINVLTRLYFEELGRDEFDQSGLVSHGGYLLKHGCSNENIESVRQQIRQSTQYKETHGKARQ